MEDGIFIDSQCKDRVVESKSAKSYTWHSQENAAEGGGCIPWRLVISAGSVYSMMTVLVVKSE